MLQCRAAASNHPMIWPVSVLHYIAEGNGIRKTGRLAGVNRETVMAGKRTAENTEAMVRDLRRRAVRRLMDLVFTDIYAPYRGAILRAHGQTVTPPRSGKHGRPPEA